MPHFVVHCRADVPVHGELRIEASTREAAEAMAEELVAAAQSGAAPAEIVPLLEPQWDRMKDLRVTRIVEPKLGSR